jgi:hypothetical protein
MKKQMLRGALMMGGMLLSAGLVIAQGPPPGGGGGAGAPIDGGITLLLGAGAAYGINKLRKNKKESTKGE